MEYLQTYFLALGITSFGFLTPGMLNMSVLKRSLQNGRNDAYRFSYGIVLATFVQALIAVTFVRYLSQNPYIFDYLTYAAIFVFLAVAGFFFYKSRQSIEYSEDEDKRMPFWAGLGLAAMNMLAIPFFVGYSIMLRGEGWLEIDPPHNYAFATGAMVGAFLLLFLYIHFADYIKRRMQFIAKNINLILAIIFLVLAGMAVYRAFFSG